MYYYIYIPTNKTTGSQYSGYRIMSANSQVSKLVVGNSI